MWISGITESNPRHNWDPQDYFPLASLDISLLFHTSHESEIVFVTCCQLLLRFQVSNWNKCSLQTYFVVAVVVWMEKQKLMHHRSIYFPFLILHTELKSSVLTKMLMFIIGKQSTSDLTLFCGNWFNWIKNIYSRIWLFYWVIFSKVFIPNY